MILPVEWRPCKKEEKESGTDGIWTISVAAMGTKSHSISLISRLF